MQKILEQIFPSKDDIPDECQISPMLQKEYLCGGELISHNGDFERVYSPIHLNDQNDLKPKYIGEYPLMSETQALRVLDATVLAYDNGKGTWPTSSIEERIECVETFTVEMKKQRNTRSLYVS